MARYVLKDPTLAMLFPDAVEAEVWWRNGDHPRDYAGDTHGFENGELRTFTGLERREKGWEGAVVRYYRHPGVRGEKQCARCGTQMHDHGWIDQGGAGVTVCPGDFVVDAGIKDEKQMRVALRPLTFLAIYDRPQTVR